MLNILLVEDDKELNNIMTMKLKESDYDVIQAFDAHDAISQLKYFHFHLIITDIMLTKSDGFHLIDHINNENLDIPIIIISSLDSPQDQIRGLELNVEDYITKPFNLDVFSFKVTKLLSKYYKLDSSISLSKEGRSLKIDNKIFDFGEIEFDILAYLYNNNGMYIKQDELYDMFYEDSDASNRAIDYAIKRIRDKLGPYSSLIKSKRGLGYMFKEDDD